MYPDLIWTIKDVMESHVHLMETAVMSDRFADERPFIMTNIDYLFTVLLPHVEKKIKVKIIPSSKLVLVIRHLL